MAAPRFSAGLLLVDDLRRPPRILLLRRSPQMKHHPGVWNLPGGGIEPGETARAAAAREAFEEAGYDHRKNRAQVRWLHDSPLYTTVVATLKGGAKRFTPVLNWESDQWAWATRQQALRRDLHPMLRLFLESVTDDFEPTEVQLRNAGRAARGDNPFLDLCADIDAEEAAAKKPKRKRGPRGAPRRWPSPPAKGLQADDDETLHMVWKILDEPPFGRWYTFWGTRGGAVEMRTHSRWVDREGVEQDLDTRVYLRAEYNAIWLEKKWEPWFTWNDPPAVARMRELAQQLGFRRWQMLPKRVGNAAVDRELMARHLKLIQQALADGHTVPSVVLAAHGL